MSIVKTTKTKDFANVLRLMMIPNFPIDNVNIYIIDQ